jgi:hypothetical protein
MQTLAFLWFELEAARRRLHETFAENQVPADAANGSADAPSSVGARCCGTVKQAPRIEPAQEPLASRFRGHGVCLAIAAVLLRVGSSLFDYIPPAAQAAPETNVSVVHPEKSGAITLQLPGQLSPYTDAPIYAQSSGYLKSWYFDIGATFKSPGLI